MTVIPGPGVLAGDSITITQAGHGLSATEWAMYQGDTKTWVQLDVTGPMVQGTDGMAVRYVSAVSGNDITLVLGGVVVTGHGLTAGPIYASTTGGAVTSTEPGLNSVRWLVGVVYDADKLTVMENQWEQL